MICSTGVRRKERFHEKLQLVTKNRQSPLTEKTIFIRHYPAFLPFIEMENQASKIFYLCKLLIFNE